MLFAEVIIIGDDMAAGGNLWLCGLSDYTGSVRWAVRASNREAEPITPTPNADLGSSIDSAT